MSFFSSVIHFSLTRTNLFLTEQQFLRPIDPDIRSQLKGLQSLTRLQNVRGSFNHPPSCRSR